MRHPYTMVALCILALLRLTVLWCLVTFQKILAYSTYLVVAFLLRATNIFTVALISISWSTSDSYLAMRQPYTAFIVYLHHNSCSAEIPLGPGDSFQGLLYMVGTCLVASTVIVHYQYFHSSLDGIHYSTSDSNLAMRH